MLEKVEASAKYLLIFIMGGALSYAGAFPFKPYLHNAFQGTSALASQALTSFGVCGGDVWFDAAALDQTGKGTGVTIAKPGQDEQSLVLTTIGQTAKLLNRKGDVLHEWKASYDALPDTGGKLYSSLPETIVYWQRAKALPDGDLIVLVNANCLSPDGLALMRLDKDSKVKWVKHGHFHHDFDIGPGGDIYALWQQPVSDVPKRYAATLEKPILDEGVEIISPDGESLKHVSILEAFAQSPFSTILEAALPAEGGKPGDRMHNNNVDVLSAEQAAAIPGAKAGNVLISLREVSALAALDLDAGTIPWATRGSWLAQHDPDVLANGHIMLFDNRGDWSREGASRVLEVDPRSEAVVWQYPDREETGKPGSLFTRIRGEQELLSNGNILVNETQGSRMLEVTRDHEVVWEYRCPFTLPDQPGQRCNIMSTDAYAAADLPFLKTLPQKSALNLNAASAPLKSTLE